MADYYRIYFNYLDTLYATISSYLLEHLGITDEQFEDLWSDVQTDSAAFYGGIMGEFANERDKLKGDTT